MLGVVLMSKRKFLRIIGLTHQKGVEQGYRIGFALGQVEANNRHYASMFNPNQVSGFHIDQILNKTKIPDIFKKAFGEE